MTSTINHNDDVIDFDADRPTLDTLRRAQTLTLDLRDLIGCGKDTLDLLDDLNELVFHVESSQMGNEGSAGEALDLLTCVLHDGRWFADDDAVRDLLGALRDDGVDLTAMDPVHALVASTLRGIAGAEDHDVDVVAAVERRLAPPVAGHVGFPLLAQLECQRDELREQLAEAEIELTAGLVEAYRSARRGQSVPADAAIALAHNGVPEGIDLDA